MDNTGRGGILQMVKIFTFESLILTWLWPTILWYMLQKRDISYCCSNFYSVTTSHVFNSQPLNARLYSLATPTVLVMRALVLVLAICTSSPSHRLIPPLSMTSELHHSFQNVGILPSLFPSAPTSVT